MASASSLPAAISSAAGSGFGNAVSEALLSAFATVRDVAVPSITPTRMPARSTSPMLLMSEPARTR